ncbi:Aerobic-type carbon monoxide dehydrogenase, middle subunit CoxM/CutM-like protein [Candidatus Desulfarcum epimagneticum]|uniref:Aerobic-type carbon monoxide dehydrogenase, middle subunit CoxM/CutM-like protein n=1 Tax=uncultured Desulfobacteraceae bacterium TaxID=218296 RepID=A0A484HG03_9BACT|nr:Aerobic-type carbon monoxide dehydrogenase, middle subunit CoxM/CutM-like protein [uncultured Desulfobacteraceae bacterium]
METFKYHMPGALDEAVSLMESAGENALYIAGGTDVMVRIKEGWARPDALISLNRIKELNALELDSDSGELRIGSRTTHRALETSAMIQSRFPIIHDAVSNIGSVQVRNVGTMGGNVANAAPSADGAVPLLALDARVEIHGAGGARQVGIADFFVGPGQTVLKKSDILTRFVIPKKEPASAGAYAKFSRRAAMELPIVGTGVLLALEEDGVTCKKARICLGVAAPTPMRAKKAEAFLTGKAVDEAALGKAGEIAAAESKVRDSARGRAWHRREIIRVNVRRMGLKCLERIA